MKNTSVATKSSSLPVAIFVVCAYALGWFVALPLWLGDGLLSPLVLPVTVGLMFAPTLALLITWLLTGRPAGFWLSTGIWPLPKWRPFLKYLGLALLIPFLLCLVALPVGQLFGVYRADWVGLSGWSQQVGSMLPSEAVGLTPKELAAVQLAAVIPGALFNLIPALGEELAWRGWLFPRLLHLGAARAIVLSGIIWGAWHAPLLLLGYNYPLAAPWLAVVLMCGMCIVVGGVLAWLRMRSQSVWPAALAHGCLNASAGVGIIFIAKDTTLNTIHASILGWSGWIVPALLVAYLVHRRAFRAPKSPSRPSFSSKKAPVSLKTQGKRG